MPRPNRERHVLAEANVAATIAAERARLDWSLGGLAKRMTDAGCPINASAIYKIETSNPPRRITVDELVALSRVLELPLDELVVAPELRAHRQLWPLLETWRALFAERIRVVRELDERESALRARIQGVAAASPEAGRIVAEWWTDVTDGDASWRDRVVEMLLGAGETDG